MEELQVRNETNELRLLFEVSQALDGAHDLADHLDAALSLMARYTGMMRGALLLVDENRAEIIARASYGLKESEVRRARYKIGEGVTGLVIQTGKPVIVPNVSEEPLFLNKTGARDLPKETISFICVPITLDGKTVGAFSADSLFAESVSLEEDMRLMRILASLIARAVRTRHEFKAMHTAVVEENRRLQHLVHKTLHATGMIGSSATFQAVLAELAQVATLSTTVLICGESGTGKELVANTIHTNSPRAGKPFVKINCAALPESLVESELFGHERGAFTGAVEMRKGRFEMAHGGTLFLDEVGDMTLLTQAKLLRTLQEKEFERVGGGKSLRVDVRLIAATNRALESMVAEGTFRHDLYYRLSVFPIQLPPLRERREDILPLAAHFIEALSEETRSKKPRISAAAADQLMSYSWPGNIRELKNVMERAVILCGEDEDIQARHLPVQLQSIAPSGSLDCASALPLTGAPVAFEDGETLEESLGRLEKRMIEDALEATGGNMVKAAAKLGVTERIIGLRMKKYGLNFRFFRKEGAGS